MAVMAHTQGVCLLVVCLEYSRHFPYSLWQSEELFALGEEEREQILISYFAGEKHQSLPVILLYGKLQ